MKYYCGSCDSENDDYKQHSLECTMTEPYDERKDLRGYTTNELCMLLVITKARLNRPGNNPNYANPVNNTDHVTLKITYEILEERE